MSHETVIIGIAGPSASGKSVLANTIVSEMGSNRVIVISEDSYYKDLRHLSMEERNKINYDHPDAFDHDLMMENLADLQRGETVEVPMYDYTIHGRSDKTRTVGPHDIVVLEGILLFVDTKLREMMDMRIYMDTALDICLLRRLSRDIIKRGRSIESVMEQYQNTVRPMFLRFTEPTKRYADIIVPRGGENRVAVEMIQAKMREILAAKD
jgi:uridine kinase